MKSWKTTTLGILTGIGMLIPEVISVLDSDPQTTISFSVIGAALAAMGIGWFARDNDKTSEDVIAGK